MTPTLRRIPLPIFRRAAVGDDIDDTEVVWHLHDLHSRQRIHACVGVDRRSK
jgi:hypothetical protein